MCAATTLISLFLLSIGANAQSSKPASTSSAISATPSITACILACVESAATANGCAYTNASCICASAQFQADAALCLTQHCTADDLKNALALQTSQCHSVSVSRSGTASITPHTVSFTAPSSVASTASLTSSIHTSASLTASASIPANSTSVSSSGVNQTSELSTRVTFGIIALISMALII
ncbi:ectomycorrhiza-regulated CFEM domain-containing protein [Laccaria bicolor S238N-H82]|uniref:Ectomycorrhiza-regulated CFEM domain-containing protein n=1 Tax=Laccaria bicolor (strain S238N-H82 / ATCC MYA-4686) TaxID=486041 RepID=B0DS11_LACBS|nr:ectomycorrhiza-regulated CFEM domain-containing protein [Laccaria bicolor S238N-H82]EDR02706.1 ectomycorrhiza-regulated CFEM domain-containing protein [Laccaria bicolor S238N-H82]|eukprot:XP_001886750.1 ectomycorrhiza-regulated CFEM domain-containing protein [Laccaria bicolor S238N-H82]